MDLTKRLLLSTLPQRDGVVLVPFVGSGSECLVAKSLGASYIGFEINPDYVKLANGILAQGCETKHHRIKQGTRHYQSSSLPL